MSPRIGDYSKEQINNVYVWAKADGDEAFAAELEKSGAKIPTDKKELNKLLVEAITSSNIPAIRILAQAGADVNVGIGKDVPLSLALSQGEGHKRKAVIQCLLELGADPNVKIGDKETLLAYARNRFDEDALARRHLQDLLISYGAWEQGVHNLTEEERNRMSSAQMESYRMARYTRNATPEGRIGKA